LDLQENWLAGGREVGDNSTGLLGMVKGNIGKPYLKDIYVPAVLNFHIANTLLGIQALP
jgi:hypothetical protein